MDRTVDPRFIVTPWRDLRMQRPDRADRPDARGTQRSTLAQLPTGAHREPDETGENRRKT